MSEITLKDGRLFNSRFQDFETALADVNDYLFCEYDERITREDVEKFVVIDTYRKVWIITWVSKSGKLHDMTYNTMKEAEALADRLAEREAKDGIKREWIIREAYVRQ